MRMLLSAAVVLGLGRFLVPSLWSGGPPPVATPTAEVIGPVQEKQGQLMQRVLRGEAADPEAGFREARQRAEVEAAEVARVAARTPGQAGAVRVAYTQARLTAEFGPDRAAGVLDAPTRAEAHNGQVGRDIGARVGREAGPNSTARTRELVIDALRRGRFDISRPVRRD